MGSAKIIIITNTQSPIPFFYHTKGNNNEDLGQFVRRIDLLVHMHDDSYYVLRPEEKSSDTIIDNFGNNICVHHTYSFQKSYPINREDALALITETVNNNMNWNKSKKVINASDQTNYDNPNT